MSKKILFTTYAFIDSQNLNFGVRNEVVNANKKTRSSGRITSLGQPGHGDTSNIAKKNKKVNRHSGLHDRKKQ